MSGEQFEISVGNLDLSFIAENDLSAQQYGIVEMSAEDQVDLSDGAADDIVGILQNKPTAGQRAIVRIFGVSRLRANTAGLAVGDAWGTDGAGRGVAKVTGDDIIGGYVLVAADAEDEIATVTVNCMSRVQIN